jgi:lipopolysaccharide/colanic/teichoic acid biosynthesis glycosyltransferase
MAVEEFQGVRASTQAGQAMRQSTSDRISRVIDVVVAGSLLVCLSPVLICIAMVVIIADGRPVLFVQERIGLNDRLIHVLKFRTMRAARAGEEASDFDGVRMTRVGRVLRSWSLDELPGLWNVLTGDVSLVGPRPLPARYLGRYSPAQRRRHVIRPGITGWAQVNGRNSLDWDERFAFDVWYVDHRSISLNLRILWLTVVQVVRRVGINYEGHPTMHEFLGTDQGRGTGAEEGTASGQDASSE